jgi:hypothetical protein
MVKRLLIVPLMLFVLAAGIVMPSAAGSVSAATVSQAPTAAHVAASAGAQARAFDKTRFVAHLAVAAFLVHYIYKKYKEGKLSHFHFFTDLKAAAAAVIAYHEIKKAYDIAKTSNSKTLQFLVSPISKVQAGLSTAAAKLGHGDTSMLNGLNSQTGTLASVAAKYGFGFKDQAPKGGPGF